MSSFKDAATFIFDRALQRVTAKLAGKPDPLEPIAIKSTYYVLECIEAHTRHIDAGIGGVSIPVAFGERIETQDISINCVDMSKFNLVEIIDRVHYI